MYHGQLPDITNMSTFSNTIGKYDKLLIIGSVTNIRHDLYSDYFIKGIHEDKHASCKNTSVTPMQSSFFLCYRFFLTLTFRKITYRIMTYVKNDYIKYIFTESMKASL